SCLSCSNPNQVVKGGQCVDAGCTSNTTVIPGLGVCLSNLVQVPPTPTGTEAPLPTITGLDNPTVINQTSGTRLEWWQILLMALGCAFIFLVIVMWWRRRMRRKRAAATKQFARAKQLDGMGGDGWRYKMVRWCERFFGHKPIPKVYPTPQPITLDNIKLREFTDVEKGGASATLERKRDRKSGILSLDREGESRDYWDGEERAGAEATSEETAFVESECIKVLDQLLWIFDVLFQFLIAYGSS
ncbi:hypothetical protein MPER_12698, partial [Moniliophthora perniciosa FA553]